MPMTTSVAPADWLVGQHIAERQPKHQPKSASATLQTQFGCDAVLPGNHWLYGIFNLENEYTHSYKKYMVIEIMF